MLRSDKTSNRRWDMIRDDTRMQERARVIPRPLTLVFSRLFSLTQEHAYISTSPYACLSHVYSFIK